MTTRLAERLRTTRVLEPREAAGLQVFGLRCEGNGALHYATLDEALAAGTLDVTEVSESGSVPVLKVVNRAEERVLLLAGEQLVGAKQNRVLNASIMVPARGELPIPVSCVEAGRWRSRSTKFASGGSMSHGQLRKIMARDTSRGYRAGGAPASDQGAVWAEVERKLGGMGSSSPTQAFDQVYEDHQQRLDDLLGALHAPEGCHGVAFCLHGKVAGADLFDQPATLAKLWGKLVRAYALDALEAQAEAAGTPPAAPVSADRVADWLGHASRSRFTPYKSPGEGDDVRLEGDALVGAALVVEERPVHVELFEMSPA